MPATITIELKGLHFVAGHGWHEEEASWANEFRVDLVARFTAIDNITSIDDTVDYTKIYALVKTVFSKRERLLETLAQNISNEIEKAFPQIQHIQLSITKLKPPIAFFNGSVGITYTNDFK